VNGNGTKDELNEKAVLRHCIPKGVGFPLRVVTQAADWLELRDDPDSEFIKLSFYCELEEKCLRPLAQYRCYAIG
jgi:hypothetical protein